jgi:hypothetical protein
MSRTNELDLEAHMLAVAKELRRRAGHGTFDGRISASAGRYLADCRFVDARTGTQLIFTRDTGHHSSGWMKNPDYERCLHLSTSPLPRAIVTIRPILAELDKKTLAAWCRTFFGEDVRYVWAESPKSEHGRRVDVWHWRLFCDERWQPILPRKEVYSLDFTELGWRSASQVLEEEGRIIESTVDPS